MTATVWNQYKALQKSGSISHASGIQTVLPLQTGTNRNLSNHQPGQYLNPESIWSTEHLSGFWPHLSANLSVTQCSINSHLETTTGKCITYKCKKRPVLSPDFNQYRALHLSTYHQEKNR